jgi:ribosome-binding ATPase YchF (GTP1/OBG family)
LKEVEQLLKAGKSVVPLREDPIVEELHLLSAKRELYLINGDEITPELKAAIEARGGEYIVADLGTMTDLSPLIRSAYHLLHLMSFYTTGEDETRAWTIVQGSKAPQAAGVIHTDFENKFIRAEVVNATKLLEAGSWAKARQKGMMRTEGKDYVMQEGDVMEVRHS